MFQTSTHIILSKANEIEDPDERAEYLKKNAHPRLLTKIFSCFHNDTVSFDNKVTKDLVWSSKQNKPGVSDSKLDIELKRLYMFQKDFKMDWNRKKVRFIQILEALPQEEAEFLITLVNQKNPYKNLNKNFVKKYFPDAVTATLKRN